MSELPPELCVLFVCTGNTCRSPLAAIALRAELGDDAASVEVSSAGTAATPGQPASEGSRRVAPAETFRLLSHCPRPLTSEVRHPAQFGFGCAREHPP